MNRKRVLIQVIWIFLLALLTVSSSRAAAAEEFSIWLLNLRQEALSVGISRQTLNEALAAPQLLDYVIKADRNQPEFRKSLDQYLEGVLSSKRIENGRQMLAENRRLLDRIARKYGVQPRFIVALWGVETYYGRHTGKVPIVDALVTLAYDGRRSAYFRQELFNALRILDAGHVDHRQFLGSWAGAMGQLQFMPSSFLNYAVDGNGDGRIDLWQTPEDYLSSAANYLARVGWQGTRTWGREVRLPDDLNPALFGLCKQAQLAIWQKYGVRRLDGSDLPMLQLRASLLQPEGPGGRAFLVYDNYRALLKWNRANSFAVAVGMLADRIGEAKR